MKAVLFFLLIVSGFAPKAQKIEHIYVNLYTDSLKKGTYNYINIDGQLSNGKYCPLDSTKISFSCAQAKFFGNSLFIPANFSPEKVNIKVVLKDDEKIAEEFTVYIKKAEDPPLRPASEVLGNGRNSRRKG